MAHNTENEGTTRATVELPDSLWERAKIFSTRQRMSFKELIANAVRMYLDKQESERTSSAQQ